MELYIIHSQFYLPLSFLTVFVTANDWINLFNRKLKIFSNIRPIKILNILIITFLLLYLYGQQATL